MKKLVKFIRIVLSALIVFGWYKGMHALMDFHYSCCPELYDTPINQALYFSLILVSLLLAFCASVVVNVWSGYRLHKIHLIFLEITKPDRLRIRLTPKLGWCVHLLPPRTDGTSPLVPHCLGLYLCYAGSMVVSGLLAAIFWRTPASHYMNGLFLAWVFCAILVPMLPGRANGVDRFLFLRKSRDLRRAWECNQHLIAAMDRKEKLRDMPEEWFLPVPAALQDELLVQYYNFNRAAWLISQDRWAEGYEGLRYFFDLKPTPKTHTLIAMAILNGVVCEALGEDANGAPFPPMCMSQLDHPSLKLPLPPGWEAQRLQAEYARALFLHHDEAEAAAILPKLEEALAKSGRDREGIENLQRKAGILPETDAE